MEYYAVGRNEVGLCGMEASPRFTMKPKKQASKGKCKGGVCVKNNHTYKFAYAWNIFVKIPKKVWTVISSGAGKINILLFTICPILCGHFLSCVF